MVLNRLRRHAAVATGNFRKLFGDMDLAPLPAAVARLVELGARDDAEVADYASVVASDSALAARVLRLVNSAAMGVANRVTDIGRAVGLLGVRRIRSVGLALGVSAALPRPRTSAFDRDAFWEDSLTRALTAKALSAHVCPDDEAEAFTAALLQNVAIPILLDRWSDYYEPVLACWRDGARPLAEFERERFRWNHAEASAWIARAWGLPDAIVCAVGLHHASWDQLAELELQHTPVAAGALASLAPSVLRPTDTDAQHWSAECLVRLGLDPPAWRQIASDVRTQLEQVAEAFALHDLRVHQWIESPAA